MTIDLPPILTVKEVAAWLQLHPITLYQVVNKGGIPAFRIGTKIRFDSQKLKEWSKRCGK